MPQSSWRQPGGGAELLRLAWPLILSNGFLTLQLTIDRIFLSWQSSQAVAAAMPPVMAFWALFALPQYTAAFVTTFVAQYIGAGRPARVGPILWQTLYFSLLSGLAFLGLLLVADELMGLGNHGEHLQQMETSFFRCLCWSAFPSLIVATVSGFFSGRGDSRTVMLLNAVGLLVNALLDYALIFGNWGLPALGIAGAGWATVAGSVVAAVLGLALVFRTEHRQTYQTVAGWRFNPALFRRLLRFGLPSGLQWALDGLAFSMFVFLVGRFDDTGAALAATSVAVTLNLIAFLPTMGFGQAVAVLVGQRLGEDRPDLAERTTWTGLRLAWLLMTAVALLYVLLPGPLMSLFQSRDDVAQWEAVASLVPVLLRFVAVYCLFDSLNLIFSFALRGAGDTRFVTLAALALSWPVMVLPTWLAWYYHWGLYWAWTFASAYIIVLSLVLLARFRGGKWKTMRVIEAVTPDEPAAAKSNALELATKGA